MRPAPSRAPHLPPAPHVHIARHLPLVVDPLVEAALPGAAAVALRDGAEALIPQQVLDPELVDLGRRRLAVREPVPVRVDDLEAPTGRGTARSAPARDPLGCVGDLLEQLVKGWNPVTAANVILRDDLLRSLLENEAALALVVRLRVDLSIVATVNDDRHVVFGKPDLQERQFISCV